MAKLCNNLSLAISMIGTAEAMNLVRCTRTCTHTHTQAHTERSTCRRDAYSDVHLCILFDSRMDTYTCVLGDLHHTFSLFVSSVYCCWSLIPFLHHNHPTYHPFMSRKIMSLIATSLSSLFCSLSLMNHYSLQSTFLLILI